VSLAVDVHTGLLSDVVLAEVALGDEADEVELPPWVGREVTFDPDYGKEALTRRAGRLLSP